MTDNLSKLDFCGQMLPNLEKYYDSADLQAIRQNIGSTFPEKLIFEKMDVEPILTIL